MTNSSQPERPEWGVMLLALGAAAVGFAVLFLLLWLYVPQQTALLACRQDALSLGARVVIALALWTVRATPFVIIVGVLLGPALVAGVVVAGLALKLWGSRAVAARLAVFAVALACAELAACGAIVYTIRAEAAGVQDCVRQ